MTTRLARFSILSAALALAALSGCANQQTNNADLRRRGDHYLEGGQYGQAIENYAQYLEKNPGDAEVRANYGRALLAQGRNADAAEQLQIAYSQRPDDEKALDALIDALIKSKQQDTAFRLLMTNASDRGDVRDHLRVGRTALRVGDTDTAKLFLETAARVDKGQTVAPQIGLVDYYLAVNDKVNAERRLRMAYFLSPMDLDVQDRIRKIKPVVGPTFPLQPLEAASR